MNVAVDSVEPGSRSTSLNSNRLASGASPSLVDLTRDQQHPTSDYHLQNTCSRNGKFSDVKMLELLVMNIRSALQSSELATIVRRGSL